MYGAPDAPTARERRYGPRRFTSPEEGRALVMALTCEGRSIAAIAKETGYAKYTVREIRRVSHNGGNGRDAELLALIVEQERDMRYGDRVGSLSLDAPVFFDTERSVGDSLVGRAWAKGEDINAV